VLDEIKRKFPKIWRIKNVIYENKNELIREHYFTYYVVNFYEDTTNFVKISLHLALSANCAKVIVTSFNLKKIN